jgi:23S rRNA A1618 N6-methylase RlmF
LYLSIIGNASYGWNLGTDIDEGSEIALQLLNKTHNLSTLLVYNNKQNRVLSLNIITREDRFAYYCNPPFQIIRGGNKGTIRKVSNLEKKRLTRTQFWRS